MADVGRLAGVSHQTVSRVINGSRHVSPETRERVNAAMRELGYRPNSIARALVTGRSKTLGVVSFDTTLYGPASTLFGIERAAHAADYFIIVASLRALDRSSVDEAVDRLRLQAVEGILVIVSEDETAQALLHASADVPLVAVQGGPGHGVPVVAVDQLQGAAAATRHLLELGHRTVHHVAGPRESLEAGQREQAWREVLHAAGADVPPVHRGDWGAPLGYAHGRELAADPEVTAVFVANDQMALGVLRAMHEAGRRIPEDVSVVGFDDIPEAPYFTPPLTTVRQDFGELGSLSLRILIGAIEAAQSGRGLPAGAQIAPSLVVRASTAPAP
ncbi:MAG TPA: LacI family DNA-binding transcriptional regulator [Solirubrobacteraceae bacterium]|nr:LacI family DNA-binding transcriptional regulator [Solirubrobacteraceae bacterium]